LQHDAIIGFMNNYMRLALDSRPIYRKLADGISAAIAENAIDSKTYLPSERGMAEELDVSRVTLRKAIDELVSEGLLVRRHGAKTTVAKRLEKTLSKLTGFSEETRARGMEPGTRWLSRATVLPSALEAMALALAPGDKVVRLQRVRLADDQAIAIERATVPAAILPSGELVGDSLYEALRSLGSAPVRGMQRIRAGGLTAREAGLLGSKPGAPVLIIERRCFLDDGRPVEFTETRYLGEYYEFLTELLV
jgi:GntR family transcriptional regulator